MIMICPRTNGACAFTNPCVVACTYFSGNPNVTMGADNRPLSHKIEELRNECARLGNMNAIANQRIAVLEAELAAMTLERDGLALQVKMRPTLQADMVPAEDLAAAQADHAYAIRMYDQKEAACIDALEKLAAAQAEVDRRVGIGAELIIARRERDALLVDAERYRWLRNECAETKIGVYEWVERSGREQRAWLADAELDAAIDAARGGK